MKKKRNEKTRAVKMFVLFTSLALAWIWSCSNAPFYGGGGRDLGPQMQAMGTTEAGAADGDSGVKTDTGVDTGVADTGIGN